VAANNAEQHKAKLRQDKWILCITNCCLAAIFQEMSSISKKLLAMKEIIKILINI
jgi:hypothetical protein